MVFRNDDFRTCAGYFISWAPQCILSIIVNKFRKEARLICATICGCDVQDMIREHEKSKQYSNLLCSNKHEHLLDFKICSSDDGLPRCLQKGRIWPMKALYERTDSIDAEEVSW